MTWRGMFGWLGSRASMAVLGSVSAENSLVKNAIHNHLPRAKFCAIYGYSHRMLTCLASRTAVLAILLLAYLMGEAILVIASLLTRPGSTMRRWQAAPELMLETSHLWSSYVGVLDRQRHISCETVRLPCRCKDGARGQPQTACDLRHRSIWPMRRTQLPLYQRVSVRRCRDRMLSFGLHVHAGNCLILAMSPSTQYG